jgi:peptide/nickel transport system ATP-binding protein/oligopeptide transport system ATP-binding protein
MNGPIVLEARELTKIYHLGRPMLGFGRSALRIDAVNDVSFDIRRGETFGIVGESGSGKSTTAKLLMRLVEPTSGAIRLNGKDSLALDQEDLRRSRGAIQMVFQDPFASLNPRLTVGYQLAEPLAVHALAPAGERRDRVAGLLERVGLDPRRAASYPHEFSGGERQRVAIARALAAEPDLIVADEAVSALDVSVRAQILNLLEDIKAQTRLSMIFISHDLSVVRHISDRVAVMYRGRIVEYGPTEAVFGGPLHPYTLELLEAIPRPVPGGRRRSRTPISSVEGVGPSTGCRYAARCALAVEACRQTEPGLVERATGHASACLRAEEVAPPSEVRLRGGADALARLRRLQARFLKGGKETAA